MMTMYRQGDVLVRRVNSIPSEAQAEPAGEVVLAYGEVTGHRHRFRGGKRSGVRAYRTEAGSRYFRASRVASLDHEEHDTIPLEPGDYEVTIQVEYVAPEVVRNVAD
jgi:hypothetical protein